MKIPSDLAYNPEAFLCCVLCALSLLEFTSCKKATDDSLSPDTSSPAGKGKVVFQLESSGGSDGIYVLDFGSQPFEPHLIVAGGMEPRPSRDGKSLVYWNISGPLFTSNIDGSNATAVLSLSDSYFNWPEWSPDGLFILFQKQWRLRPKDELVLIDRTGANPRTVVDTLTVSRSIMPRWSPDGSLIAFFGQDSLGTPPWLTTVAPGGSQYTRRVQANYWWLPEWSPDSRRVAFAGPKTGDPSSRSFVIDLSTGVVSEIGAGLQPIRQARWLPDGRLLCWDESTIYISGDKPPYATEVVAGGFSTPPFPLGSADSSLVGVFGRRGGGSLDFFTLSAQGGTLQKIATISSSSDSRISESQPPQWLQ